MDRVKKYNRLISIDVETTGLDHRKGHRIVEVGAVAMENNQIMSEYQSLIRVDFPIPRHVSRVHGITNEMLTGQPEPENVFPELKEFIKGSILIAHNAKFDIGFLRSEFNRLKLSFNNQIFCTLEIGRRRYPRLPNYKLETLYHHLVGPVPSDMQRHRALTDARMVAALWMAMERK